MLSCKDYTLLVEQGKEEKLSLTVKLKMTFHKIICKYCKFYEEQSLFIDNKIKSLLSFELKMPEKRKQNLQSNLILKLKSEENQ